MEPGWILILVKLLPVIFGIQLFFYFRGIYKGLHEHDINRK